MKTTLFKKIILLFLATTSFSNLLQSTPITDLTNDLSAKNPDLVQTLKDGIALRDYYKSAGQPQLFSKYEVQLEEFFYKNLGMPFDDICDIMENKKMSAAEVIDYVNSNQGPTNNKGSQALENFYSATTSAIANNPNFKDSIVKIDKTPTDLSIKDNTDATVSLIDLCSNFSSFYSTTISTITSNSKLVLWDIKKDSLPTKESVAANEKLLKDTLANFDSNEKGILIDSLRPVFYKPIPTTTLNYLKNSEIIFDDGTGSVIKLSTTYASGDASIGEIADKGGILPSTSYLKDPSKYKELVAALIDTVMAVTKALLKGNKAFDSGNGSLEKEQKWFNDHKLGDKTSAGLKAQLLAAIG